VGNQLAGNISVFEVLLPPTVTSINPSSGPTTGGTVVIITGANFTGATAVEFGTTSATFLVDNAAQITAVSPPGTGTVDVTVTTPVGTSATSSFDQFTYFPPPTVTSVMPSTGPTTGGTSVTITGTNFTGATAVNFGITPATSFTVNSDTSISAVSPAGVPGTVDITVTTPFGTSTITLADQFTYFAPSPPKDLKGHQVKNEFATQTDIINILTWKAPSTTSKPVAYRIYRDKDLTKLAAEVSANEKLQFLDHNRKKNHTYHYFVVSVDAFGNVSAPAEIVIY
jgi:hypothetical protein